MVGEMGGLLGWAAKTGVSGSLALLSLPLKSLALDLKILYSDRNAGKFHWYGFDDGKTRVVCTVTVVLQRGNARYRLG